MPKTALIPLLLTLFLAPLTALAQSPDPAGDWKATMKVGALDMRLALHLSPAASSLDSPDQGAFGVPATMTREGDKVLVLIPGVGRIEGVLSADGQTLTGTLTQAAAPMPVTFTRGVFARANRPQTPLAPFPYNVEDVAYANPKAGNLRLAGTLTTPAGAGPHPAVLLITGSGAQDRDESLFEHKPFLVLADALTRRGIAVLRVDDRGIGGSARSAIEPTSADLAGDVEAGVAFLRARAGVDPARIGLIGHSEGGVIGPMVAARDPKIAFVVMLAGTGVPGDATIVEQVRLLNLAAGASPEAAQRSADIQRQIVSAITTAPDAAAAEAAGVAKARELIGPQAGDGIKTMVAPWYRYFLSYDPAPALRELKVPVLALLGGKDVQVGAAQNGPALRAALAANPRAQVHELAGLNHLFQTARTGNPDEYGQIEETMAPGALALIGDWVERTAVAR